MRSTSQSLTISTPWPEGRWATPAFVAVTVLGLVFLIIPRPTGWPASYLFAEDGPIWLGQFLQQGFAGTLDPYAGYVHVVPRLIAGTCATLTPPTTYPLCTDSASVIVRLIGMGVAFPVLAACARSWGWGLLAASAFVWLPAGQLEVLGNITNVRWFLLAAAAYGLIGVWRGLGLVLVTAAVGFLAAMSDPASVFLVPLATWRFATVSGRSRVPAVVFTAGALAQLVFSRPSSRGGLGSLVRTLGDPVGILEQLLIRGALTTQYGLTVVKDLLASWRMPAVFLLLALPVVLIALAWRSRAEYRSAFALGALLAMMGFGYLYLTLSFASSDIALTAIWGPSQPARYSVAAGIFLGPSLILMTSIAWRGSTTAASSAVSRIVVVAVLAAMVVAVAVDFRGEPRTTDGVPWAHALTDTRADCTSPQTILTVKTAPSFEAWLTPVPCWWVTR